MDPAPLKPFEERSLLERIIHAKTRRRRQQADKVINELYDDILKQKPTDCDGVVIDVKARDWKYGNYCTVGALIPTMKYPQHSYVRQILTEEEWEEVGRELRDL